MGNGVVFQAAVAIVAGLVVSVLLFVPFVALSYRRRGRLSAGRMLAWLAAVIYFWAIWAYTLLPLPQVGSYRCAGINLDPLGFIPDIQRALAAGGNPLRRTAIQQLVLNVALFMPLGFFLRTLAGRGVLVATAAGFGVSAMVEFTQLTGVWGLYPCAYRVFDVVDLQTNTLGALLGSVVALLVPGAWRRAGIRPEAALPHPVTRGRRMLAMLCDVLAATLLGFATTAAFTTAVSLIDPDSTLPQGSYASWLGSGLPAAVWLVLILATGRSVGDYAVQLRYRGGRQPVPLARLMRALGGIPGYALLGLPSLSGNLQAPFALAAFLAWMATPQGRGLPGLLSGQDLADARATHEADARPQNEALPRGK